MVKSGVFIQETQDIIADQVSWVNRDELKNTDFSKYPYWLTTDDGQNFGITDDADLNEHMSTIKISAENVEDYRTPEDMTGLYVYFKGQQIGETPPGLCFLEISRSLAVLPDGMCMVVDYQSFL